MPHEMKSQRRGQSHVSGRPPARPPSRQLHVSRGYSKGRPVRWLGLIVTRVLPAACGLARGVRRDAPQPLAVMPVWLFFGRRVLSLVALSLPASGASLHAPVLHSHNSQGLRP